MRNLKKFLTAILLLATLPFLLFAQDVSDETNSKNYASKSDVLFIQNDGQIKDNEGNLRPDILFMASTGGMKLYFMKDGVSTILTKLKNEENALNSNDQNSVENKMPEYNIFRYDMKFLNINHKVEVMPNDLTDTYYNYLTGNHNISKVKTYKKLTYKNLYEGIDVVFYTGETGFKYDFVINPGADPNQIRMNYIGIDGIIKKDGKIKINTPFGTVIEKIPLTYKNNKAKKIIKQEIQCNYIVEGNTIGFNISDYNNDDFVVIDPAPIWSSYVGGSDVEIMGTLAGENNQDFDTYYAYSHGGVITDSDGNIIITGSTLSDDFPATTGSYSADYDVFVFKLNPSGSTRLYGAYLGGSKNDLAADLAVDEDDNIYIIGSTKSDDYPVSNAFQSSCSSCTTAVDVFITKLSPACSTLVSTFLGGEDEDYGHRIKITTDDKVVVLGETISDPFISSGSPIRSCA